MNRILSALGLSRRMTSFVCQSKHFESDWYRRWTLKIAKDGPDLGMFGPEFARVFRTVWDSMIFDGKTPRYRHRKMWEWCAISQALEERGMLKSSRTGVGFAVGHEPLPSLFASFGANILATDLGGGADDAWAGAGQQADSLRGSLWPNLIDWESFSRLVQFRSADMRTMDGLSPRSFDFCWSSCALEHLGSLEAGMEFIDRATDILKPGGIGVHTTEFNVTSETETLISGDSVIYRKSDLQELEQRVSRRGARLHAINFETGNEDIDRNFDFEPYYTHGNHHVKLKIDSYVATSILLIIEKGR